MNKNLDVLAEYLEKEIENMLKAHQAAGRTVSLSTQKWIDSTRKQIAAYRVAKA